MNNIEESSEKKENKYLSFIKKNKTILLSITIAGLLVIAGYFSIKSIIFENKYKEAEVERIKITKEKNDISSDYTAYRTKMKKYEELSEDEAKQKLEELEKKKQKEKEKQEAEEKKGYDSGITYEQVSREPKTYSGKKVKFSGKVIQVSKGDSNIRLRVAVDGNYKNIILVEYDSSIVSKNVLEDDKITVSGIFAGEISYKATSGATISVPGMLAKHIEFN